MKKKFLLIGSTIVCTVAICATFFASRQNVVFADDETPTLYRHSLSLDPSNRTVYDWSGNASSGYKREFSLSGTTELGNEYHSNQFGCYTTVYDTSLASFDSNDYICRIEMEPGEDNRCSLSLSFDARSNVPIKPGMIEYSEHVPIIYAEISYNDSENHENHVLENMNYDLGYATDVLFLSGSNLSLTLYSVTVVYSCTY